MLHGGALKEHGGAWSSGGFKPANNIVSYVLFKGEYCPFIGGISTDTAIIGPYIHRLPLCAKCLRYFFHEKVT